MMIEAFKRQDGEGHGANKVGEGSGENIPEPPKTHHKNDFPQNLTILGTDWTQPQLHPCFLDPQMISKSLSSL
jgi:hypothetical protein